MENRRFSRAYPELPEKIAPSNPERRELLSAPREWMHFFDETMHNYLSGQEAPDRLEFYDQLNAYYDWSQRHLPAITEGLRAIDNPTDIGHVSSELNFHQLNGPLTYFWNQLLFDEYMHFNPQELTNVQAHIAVKSALPMQRFRQIGEPTPTQLKEWRALKGSLTESDSLITLIELMKKNTDLVVVPAPLRFEANNNTKGEDKTTKNADFMVVDKVERQTRGLQVKTGQINMGQVKHYDKNFVTMIGGDLDLGNTLYKGREQISLPGQIAMGLLSERHINNTPPSIHKREYLRSRAMAREIMRGRRPYLQVAQQYLGERVLHDLYVNPPEDIEEIVSSQEAAHL